jgi:hypothetical protein
MKLKRELKLIKLSDEELEVKLKRARKMSAFCYKHLLSHNFIEKH